MVSHTCPVCGWNHEVREARAEVAYGRQLTCSPECESERRRRRRYRPFRPLVAEAPLAWWQRLSAFNSQVLHTWVVARVQIDLLLAAQRLPRRIPRRG